MSPSRQRGAPPRRRAPALHWVTYTRYSSRLSRTSRLHREVAASGPRARPRGPPAGQPPLRAPHPLGALLPLPCPRGLSSELHLLLRSPDLCALALQPLDCSLCPQAESGRGAECIMQPLSSRSHLQAARCTCAKTSFLALRATARTSLAQAPRAAASKRTELITLGAQALSSSNTFWFCDEFLDGPGH